MRRVLSLTLAGFVVGGCAYFYPHPGQAIAIEARSLLDEPIAAHCTAGNDRGTWQTVTPGRVQVLLSRADLAVQCVAEGHPVGHARVLAAAAAPNPRAVLEPGGWRTFADPVLDPAQRYASRIVVVLGRSVIVGQ